VHEAIPVQAPLQPVKREPAAAVAVSVTTVPSSKSASQVAPQLIVGAVTVPKPVLVTLRPYTAMKLAVTVRAWVRAQKAAEAQIAAIQAQDRRNYLLSLRQADAMAATGKTDQANDIYNTIVTSSAVPREIVAEAAVGLYRTGAFRNAVNAFRKLVPYARGEEDLRYYNAVSLYEAGEYDDAKKELACALPYIQVTADVTRYREKIERKKTGQKKTNLSLRWWREEALASVAFVLSRPGISSRF